MNPHTRKYHVVIVHYGDVNATLRLINELKQCKQPPDTVIVVNNDKYDLSKIQSSNCILIETGENKGYAAGFNIGLGALMARKIDPNDVVTCINNDIAMKPDAFLLVRRWWKKNPEPALVGFATSQDKVMHAYGYVNLFTGRSCLSSTPKESIFQMHYVHGAFLSAPLKLFIDNHGIPEKYFMYWEDVLFSRQITERKFSLKVVPMVMATHSFVGTDSDDKLYYLVRNGALCLEQETSLPWRAYWFVVNRARYVYHRVRRSRKPIVIEALGDAINGVIGPRSK